MSKPKKKRISKDIIEPVYDMKQWFFYRFRINDQFGEPKWWIDLYIIDQIMRKILDSEKPNFDIDLWRFHRRNGKDTAGHQVTFLCLIDEKTSKKINSFIKKTPAYKILSNNKILKEYFLEEGGYGIGGSGDRHWPSEISESWPYFIKGASETVLKMLKIMTETHLIFRDIENILDIEDIYKDVNNKLEYIWYMNGGHSFIHHLNALFGYQKLKTTQHIVTSF